MIRLIMQKGPGAQLCIADITDSFKLLPIQFMSDNQATCAILKKGR